MARSTQRDLMSKLAEAGEQAIQRLGESAANAEKVMGVATTMRDRVDEIQRKVRGIDALEKRLDKRLSDLEKKVDRLSKGSSSSARSTGRKTSSSSSRSRPSTSGGSGSSSRKSSSS